MDLTNTFHQVPVAEHTSNMLSVMNDTLEIEATYVYTKRYCSYLRDTTEDLHESVFDFKDWILTLFDNLLILRHMYDDGMNKLRKVRDRCYECNVVLKFSKSTFGFTHVKFFGY